MKQDKIYQRIQAAAKLLDQDSTSKQKFNALKKLIKGIDPKIDKTLSDCAKTWTKLEKIKKGKVIDLTIENLPDKTKEQKKRKKLLLLFLKQWKKLKSEVKRVKKQVQRAQKTQPQGKQLGNQLFQGGKIVALAKGKAGVITIVAAGIVAAGMAINSQLSTVTIANHGCGDIAVADQIALPTIPGLKLPASIPNDSQISVKLPPIKIPAQIQPTSGARLSILKKDIGFSLPSRLVDVTLDDQSIIGTNNIQLKPAHHHLVTVTCTR